MLVEAERVHRPWAAPKSPSYSYHPGGYKEVPYRRVMERHPDRIVREAVRRMLPKNALGRQMLRKLKVNERDNRRNL